MISLKACIAAWDKFFFEPKATEGIAVFRILWCGVLLVAYLLDLGNLADFYGPHSLTSLQTVKSQFPLPHMNIFHLFGTSYDALYLIIGIYGVALICAVLGFYTRHSLLVVLICITSLHQRNIWLLSSSELLMRSITILLLCSPCGHSLSIDSILGRKNILYRRPRDWAPWALRLIQIQLSVVYLWTVWHKMKGETWFDGTALYYATRLDSMTNFPVPFVLDSMPFIRLMTWGTLLVEFSLGLLVWFKELRKPVILAGILFHLGIEYTMSIPFFEVIMIVLILNFYTPEEYRHFIQNIKLRLLTAFNESTIHPAVKDKLIWVFTGSNE